MTHPHDCDLDSDDVFHPFNREGVSKVNVGLRLGEPSLTYPQAERSDSETRDLRIGPPLR